MPAALISCVTSDRPLHLSRTPFPSGSTVSPSRGAVRIQCQALINLVNVNSSISIIIVALFIIIILLLLGLSALP